MNNTAYHTVALHIQLADLNDHSPLFAVHAEACLINKGSIAVLSLHHGRLCLLQWRHNSIAVAPAFLPRKYPKRNAK